MGKQNRIKGRGKSSSKLKLKEFHDFLVQGKLNPSSNSLKSDKIGNNIKFLQNQFNALESDPSDEESELRGDYGTPEVHRVISGSQDMDLGFNEESLGFFSDPSSQLVLEENFPALSSVVAGKEKSSCSSLKKGGIGRRKESWVAVRNLEGAAGCGLMRDDGDENVVSSHLVETKLKHENEDGGMVARPASGSSVLPVGKSFISGVEEFYGEAIPIAVPSANRGEIKSQNLAQIAVEGNGSGEVFGKCSVLRYEVPRSMDGTRQGNSGCVQIGECSTLEGMGRGSVDLTTEAAESKVLEVQSVLQSQHKGLDEVAPDKMYEKSRDIDGSSAEMFLRPAQNLMLQGKEACVAAHAPCQPVDYDLDFQRLEQNGVEGKYAYVAECEGHSSGNGLVKQVGH